MNSNTVGATTQHPQKQKSEENVELKVKSAQIARILLGIIFTVSGVNYFFDLVSLQFSPEGLSFVQSLEASGFVWPIIKSLELLCGTMLIFGYFGPFALFVLAPISLGIILFHVFLSPGPDAILGYVVFALELGLLIYWRKHFLNIFREFFNDVDHNPIA